MMVPEHRFPPVAVFIGSLGVVAVLAIAFVFVHLSGRPDPRSHDAGRAMADRADAPPAAPCQLPTFAVVGGVGCTTQTHHNAVCVACMTGGQCVRFNPYDCPEP